ncbi:3-deoxy-manno-octulosonate-8-phosphatase KdsC [Alteromonadaceae bacterium BrNp21-10]|nr:3-deoxy-manno-octulosonate-8-phosphatase KdsC [Alteromonadaceae bacterium BrNp21-10]
MTKVDTLYGSIQQSVFDQFTGIKLLVCDVDGIFSDGRIYLGNQGEELKAFHTQDGYGIKAIQKIGIAVAVITGRQSNIVQSRMQSLGIAHIIQGEENKGPALASLMQQLQLSPNAVAAMGDDMPDTGMFKHAGLRLTVADGHPQVLKLADYITSKSGGFGAVREVCDLLLQAQTEGGLNSILGSST